MQINRLETDILIIGGGAAGCYAAVRLGREEQVRVMIAEKANIERSGSLAAGVNALNAYISKGHTPQDYVEYARWDANGIVRGDLLLSMADRFNAVTEDLEKRGLTILKDENGEYATRGWRNVKINGENIKPILAEAARRQKNVRIFNHLNMTDLLTDPEGTSVTGAVGFHTVEEAVYVIAAKKILIASGGAAGLYRPNNPGEAAHKMWYCPFNTGAGYAMGLKAGAEMTTFEMRFIALRCKDTIAPSGTLAVGAGAKQVNALGEIYEERYGLRTSERVYGTVMENREGRGPCFLQTEGISAGAEEALYKAYLNMAPSQTLQWLASGRGPSVQNVEIEGTEPYIVGGHTASGYWVDTGRETTIKGLYAAGDAAGGAPQKYVTGALAEGEIAAESMLEALNQKLPDTREHLEKESSRIIREYEKHFKRGDARAQEKRCRAYEEAMQKIMDEYAGGIRTDYRYHTKGLKLADEKISRLLHQAKNLEASDFDGLQQIYELKERLLICRAVIAHLLERKETRWHSFGEYTDYPDKTKEGLQYVNSIWDGRKIRMIRRPLVEEGNIYSHQGGGVRNEY